MTTDCTLPTTLEGLRELIAEANSAYTALQMQLSQEVSDTKASVAGSISTLDALLGPEGAAPWNPDGSTGDPTIRGLLAHGDEVIGQNAPIVLPLLVHGLGVLTSTVLDIARVVGED